VVTRIFRVQVTGDHYYVMPLPTCFAKGAGAFPASLSFYRPITKGVNKSGNNRSWNTTNNVTRTHW
jgi:hypothetical protein